MAPIVSTQGNHDAMALATLGAHPGRGTISLSTLIDYIIQRTYHEITVLAELLPKKSDMERKIDIVQFAHRTRQLFIRLLALVKWANSAGKVDKCGHISSFLDRQSLFFVDSADMFAKMARETLVHGRLPNFSLPCAIDVLTTGSYPRLPACIRDRIVPPDPITPAEKQHTLTRLSQIIQHRLVTHPLPAQLHNLKIDNGRVKFLVEHEFTATLTLMGDLPSIPWRLLDIDILVEDPEIGDGKALVHSLQVHYIHQVVQARLLENDKALHDLYNCLHWFCQSLQLEVLFSQAERLLRDRYGDYVRIDEYLPGKSLILSYWREHHKESKDKQFTVQVHCDRLDANKPLQVTHVPGLNDQDAARAGQAIKSDHLSLEKLLAQTIQVRSEGKLKSVENLMKGMINGNCEMRDVPTVLYVPILQPLVPTEMLRVSVDILRGVYLVSVAQYPECPVAMDIEQCLNERKSSLQLQQLITDLRVWLALRRCEKSAQYLPASVCYTLPFSNLSGHGLEKLAQTKLFIRIGGQSSYYLVVEARQDADKEVNFDYYMINTTPIQEEGAQPTLLKAGHLVKLDRFTITHSHGSKIVNENESTERIANTRKRKLYSGKNQSSNSKQMKFTSQFVPELTHIYALCEERVPYVLLTGELDKRGFSHQGIRVDGNGACLALTLLHIPDLPNVKASTLSSLRKNMVSCTFRLQRKPVRLWLVELMFNSMIVLSQNRRECGPLYRAHLQYDFLQPDLVEKVVTDFMEDWLSVALLYELVLDFREEIACGDVTVDVISYSFKRLCLAYGPGKRHTVAINWKSGMYQLVFAVVGSTDSANCHSPMVIQLTQEFNRHKSIATLIKTLDNSVVPFTALQKLTSIPTPGLVLSDVKLKPTSPLTCNFSLLNVTSWHVRVVYRNVYCLDVQCKDSGTVCIRDGAYSLYDATKVMAGFTPVPSLKAFLEMFAGTDHQHQQLQTMMYVRRRSTNDDDNPPSPVGMEAQTQIQEPTFMPHQHLGSPASRRFPPPASPMTPSSNPHTPASPSAARIQQSGFVSSPAAAFQQLASPPSIPGPASVAPSPSATGCLGTPSPGMLQGINSPGTASLPVTSPGFVAAPSPAGMSHLPSPATSNFLNPGSQEPPSPFSHARLTSLGSPASVPHPSPRPYNIMSPGTPQNPLLKEEFAKPTSISSQYPSRILPQRAWAASVPTQLSHQSLLQITRCPSPFSLCPLEQFLGCVYMRRQIQKNIQTEEGLLTVPNTSEPGVIHYKTDSVRVRVCLNQNTLQSLQIQVQPVPDYQDQFAVDDMKVLEEYFEHKVACFPYKPGAVTAFNRILGTNIRILRDFINLMRLELAPDRTLNWSSDLCLTFSPASPLGATPGTPAILVRTNKILFLLQLTRLNGQQATPGGDQTNYSVIIPFLYDISMAQIHVAENKNNASPAQLQMSMGLNQVLKRFYEYNLPKAQQGECLLFPTIRDLLATFMVPQ